MYKLSLLEVLSQHENISLTLVIGEMDREVRKKLSCGDIPFSFAEVSKVTFGISVRVWREIRRAKSTNDFDWIMLPAEKKNFLLLFYLKLVLVKQGPLLFSYNHEKFKSNVLWRDLDILLSKFFYVCLDKIIYYTEAAMTSAVQRRLTKAEDSFFANNTLARELENDYVSPNNEQATILFIGRLIPSKRLDLFIKYYERLSELIPDLKAEIIGDGPDSVLLRPILQDRNVIWHASVYEEERIARIINDASLVFVPGRSGLSINHAFLYGRPYCTLKNDYHGPEISYLKDNCNGLILEGDISADTLIIRDLLLSSSDLERMSINAFKQGRLLTASNWSRSIYEALK